MRMVLKTVFQSYVYESKTERVQHIKWMEKQGFKCAETVDLSDSFYAKFSKNYN